MSCKVFSAMVPKADQPILVNDVNTYRQVFHDMPEQLRVIMKIGKHGQTRRLPVSSAIRAGNFTGQKLVPHTLATYTPSTTPYYHERGSSGSTKGGVNNKMRSKTR